jgi:hypothetical protein
MLTPDGQSEPMDDLFPVGTLVWAKVKGHRWAPGRILSDSEALTRRPRYKGTWFLVYFFHDDKQAFVSTRYIEPYGPNKGRRQCDRPEITAAIAEAEQFAASQAKNAVTTADLDQITGGTFRRRASNTRRRRLHCFSGRF